jgi:Cu/Ag efflux pump CusA
MPAVVARLGSLPLAYDARGELLQPLAVTSGGGLAVATLRLLIVVPNLYLLAHARRERFAARVVRGRRAVEPSPRHADLPAAP